MDAFPAFFPLAGRKVVVVGSGEAADNKARLFEGSPAVLVRLGEADAGASGAYDGAALVFIASHDEALIVRTAALARAKGAAVNVVDHPALCDFYTPAVIDRGAVVVAVGATGAAPLLAAMLRSDIEALIPEGVGRLAVLFRETRDQVRAALPDFDARRAFLRDALTGPAAQAALAGDMDAALSGLRVALGALGDGAAKPVRRINFIVGDSAADLLSLRAVRTLSIADVLVTDPRCDPQIAAMARRDARRIAFTNVNTAMLIDLTGEGLRVVYVSAEAPERAVLEALSQAGAAVEVFWPAPS